MIRLILKCSGANWHLYSRCGRKDQNLIAIMSMMIPISSFFVGYAFYTFIYFFTESNLISMCIGVILFLFAFWHDQSLLSNNNLKMVSARIMASLLISAAILIPYNTTKNEVGIREKMQQTYIDKNFQIRSEMNEKIEAIEKKGEELNENIEEASKNRHNDSQPWYEARRSLNAFNANKQARISEIKEAYKGRIHEPEITKMDVLGFYVSNIFNPESKSELAITFIFMVFLLFVEASPAVLRFALEDGEYMSDYNHYFNMKRTIRHSIREDERKLISTGDQNLIDQVMMIEIKKEKEKQIENGFSEPQKLIEIAKLAEVIKKEKSNSSEVQNDIKPTSSTNINSSNRNNDDDEFEASIPVFV